MSGSFDDFDREERALRHALHGKVDMMTSTPLATRDVHAKARGIRRRRQAIAGAGIAAALAVIVPTAIYAGGTLDNDTTPPVTTGSPSPSQGSDPTTEPSQTPTGPVVFETGDLATGDAPAVDYAELDVEQGIPVGGVIHTADGRTIDLPPGQLREFAVLGDGWVVSVGHPDDGREQVYLLDRVGNYSEAWDSQGDLAVGPGGSTVAWVGADFTVRVAGSEGVVELGTLPDGTTWSVGAVVGPDCATAADCRVLVNNKGGQQEVYDVTGDQVQRLDGYVAITAAFGSLVAGMTSVDDLEPSSCSDLFDAGTGDVVWDTCDNTLGAFSPDGSAVLGLPSYGSGLGDPTLDLLDAATGDPLVQLTSKRDGSSATAMGEVWEDDTHLLTIAYDDGAFSIVRVGLDGSMDYAVEPVPGVDVESTLRLPTR